MVCCSPEVNEEICLAAFRVGSVEREEEDSTGFSFLFKHVGMLIYPIIIMQHLHIDHLDLLV